MSYFPKIKTQNGNVTITLDSSRFERQFQEAQQYLGNQVLIDSTPLVPLQDGMLRESGKVVNGGEEVVWNSPYAHYQYYGIVMVDPAINASGFLTKEGWRCHKGAIKEKTGKSLQYHTAGTGSFWFENAKSNNLEEWVGNVKKIAGGG